MKSVKSMKLATVCAALTVTVSVLTAAIVSVNIEWYENELVKKLSKQFESFFNQASQDRVYVQTDKSFYKPGETVWLTAFLRNENDFMPSDRSDIVHVELVTPKGTIAKHYKLVAKNGIAQGDFTMENAPGGLYKIRAYTEWQRNDTTGLAFEKEINFQEVILPRLKMKIDFEKKAYGQGDEVTALLELNSNQNKPIAKKPVNYVVSVAGEKLSESRSVTDETGKVNMKFTLPKDLSSIDGTLNVMFDFEGATESVSRSIPIVLNKIALEFFPEGGDLVQNVNSKVAFRATNEFGKPADVDGVIVNSKGEAVASFSSFHFGMGAFDLRPIRGQTYKARITRSEGINEEYKLPEPLTVGYTLELNRNNESTVDLLINSWQEEELAVAVQSRGQLLFAKSFHAAKGGNRISINTKSFPAGVAQATLFDRKGIARCERLLFINRNKQLNITMTTDKTNYKPREEVNLDIRVTDNNGLPVSGNFAFSVVDDNLLSFADDRQGSILSKMLLEPDLKAKVEEPDFYFDKNEPQAEKALDLLMLTAGWRKFTWKQIIRNEIPVTTHVAEKAEYSGVVFEEYTRKPLAGVKLTLSDYSQTVFSDREGKFEFKKFDINEAPNVEASLPGYNTVNKPIGQYKTNEVLTMYQERAMLYDMVAEAAIEEVQDKAMRRAPAANGVKEKWAVAIEGNADKRKAPADLMDIPKEINEKNLDNEVVTIVAEGDDVGRFYKKEEDEKVMQTGTFYRARIFAQKTYSKEDSTRSDFATTLFWNGNVETDSRGRASVKFRTNDLISSFSATLEGFGDDGLVGRGVHKFSTLAPLVLDTKIPANLICGDHLMLPVFIKNNTTSNINGRVAIKVPPQLNIPYVPSDILIAANESKVIHLPATVTNQIGEAYIEISFHSDSESDVFKQKIHVTPKGFPATISFSGQDMQKTFSINPVNVVPGSMRVSFTAYPSVMTELMSGVESILREPYGCFEQTSSSNYPNIMVLQYLKTTKETNPALEAKATNLLHNGYQKLVAFETKENGYEWFGAAPAHEALTAYGLMEFVDMKSVYDGVDDGMIARTRKLLLDKRDGNGGFKKNARALDSFGSADVDITNAYIVYALSEAGEKGIDKELDAVEKEAKKSNDPYTMALVANALFNLNEEKRGEAIINQLISAKNEAGFWTGEKHSITRSTGEGLKAETTSLVLLALMKSANPNLENINQAVKFLVGARSGYGGFGSTQATILVLKALTKYAEFSKKTDESGTIEVMIDGEEVAAKNYAKGERDAVVISGLEKHIRSGRQTLEVKFSNCRNALPYSVNVTYNTSLPESNKACVTSLQTKLSTSEAKVGETIRLTVDLKNKTREGQPMTMAVVGIPAGLSLQPWQLKEMQEKGVFDFYEVSGNFVAIYYRSLAPVASKTIVFDLKAEIPGEYEAPASSTYLYYTNELKNWVATGKVVISE